MSDESLPFDRIVIQLDGSTRAFTLADFMRLPLHDRIQRILSREIEFLNAGEPVDRTTALRRLRIAAARG